MRRVAYIFEHSVMIKRMFLLLSVLCMILISTMILSTIVTAKHTQAAQRETVTAYESICITSGDSLWSIAQQYRGTEDTAIYVETLKQLNGLSNDRIQVGSYILVPVTSVL